MTKRHEAAGVMVASSSSRIFFVAGVYRSASTWVANVAAAVLETRAPTRIINADSYLDLFRASCVMRDHIVVKTHKPDATLRFFFEHARPPLILTVREPTACIASLVLQFGSDLRTAWDDVVLSCQAVERAGAVDDHLTLRYEDDSRDAASVLRIADHLGVPLSPEAAEDIAVRFSTDQVRLLIESLDEQGLFGSPRQPFIFHRRTHWHHNHIGTGQDRSSEVLTPQQVTGVNALTLQFRLAFGYLKEGASRDADGEVG